MIEMDLSAVLPGPASRDSVRQCPEPIADRLRGGRTLIALGLFVVAALSSEAASVEGRVALPKSVSAPVVNQRYEIVSKAGVLSTNPPAAIVYVEGEFSPARSLPVQQIAQKDLAFVPSLLAIQSGTRVEFPNLDPIYHNIFSFSPAKRFDLGRYRSDEKPSPSVVFDTPGLVTLRCDIHEHMRALILVLATPFFVITDAAGHYRIDGLPPGHYTVKAWLNSRSIRESTVDLRDGNDTIVDFP